MKKLSIVLASLVAMLIVTSAQARDQIKIVGSSTVFPYATIVAERFGAGGKFKTPVIESTGTGGGAKLFCAGVGAEHPDITNASRAMKSKEYAECQKNGVNEIAEINIGNDGITLAFNKDAKPVNFTKAQLYKALVKEVVVNGQKVANPYKKWSDIDPALPNYDIKVMVPPSTSGTRDAWGSLVMEKGISKEEQEAKIDPLEFRTDGPVIEVGENDALIVQKLSQDKELFGFFGFSYFLDAKDKLQAASIEGKQPSLKGIQDYSYPIARPLFFYVKLAHVQVIPGLHDFIKEFTSTKSMGAKGYLASKGLVPSDAKTYKTSRDNAVKLVNMPEKK